ncbi:MAG: menaquinone biosynthesis protein [Aquificae bacterium]|nr:menaquinone biosynthesis protein [Aquificota bacterium]
MKIGWIDFLNTTPFDFRKAGLNLGFKHSFVKGYPAQINEKLGKGEVDVGLVSSAHYLENWEKLLILPEMSVSGVKSVKSVIILSDIPIEEIKKIHLTTASKTSRYLTKVIFKKFLKKQVEYRDLTGDIKDKEAVLLIGDTAIKLYNSKRYVYDLSDIWYQWTGLPFVFALWSVREDYFNKEREKVYQFFQILKESKNLFEKEPKQFVSKTEDIQYLKGIDYNLSEKHIQSLNLFSSYLLETGIIEKKPTLRFAKWKG